MTILLHTHLVPSKAGESFVVRRRGLVNNNVGLEIYKNGLG